MPLTRATTTPMPDEIYDVWAPQLGEAELKVLLYIVRRTLGFRKHADAISLTQFVRGLRTRDGRVLDHGCGVRNRTNLIRALRDLEAKGLISACRADTAAGDSDVTAYALRWERDVASGAAFPGGVAPASGGLAPGPRWSLDDAQVVPDRHQGGPAATPTTNSIPTNRQQDRLPMGAGVHYAHKDTDLIGANARLAGDERGRAVVVWRTLQHEMRGETTPSNFDVWFAPTRGVRYDGRVLTVAVPTEGHRHWLSVRLRRRIAYALGRLGHGRAGLDFVMGGVQKGEPVWSRRAPVVYTGERIR